MDATQILNFINSTATKEKAIQSANEQNAIDRLIEVFETTREDMAEVAVVYGKMLAGMLLEASMLPNASDVDVEAVLLAIWTQGFTVGRNLVETRLSDGLSEIGDLS